MFDTRVEVLTESHERDEYNERRMELISVGIFWAQRTESGGRENLYASRIVHQNDVVFTTRYTDKIKAGMVVRSEGEDMKITSTHQEGRRQYLHIKCTKSDGVASINSQTDAEN